MKRALGPVLGVCAVLGCVAPAAASGGGRIGLAYGTGGERGQPRIVIANANGGHRRTLAAGGVPAVAPNGSAVAFGTESGKVAVDVYSAAGKLIGHYFNGRRVEAGPIVWSSDSRYLAVGLTDVDATTRIGESGLAIIDTVTGRATTIAHGQLEGVTWGPTSDTLVYGLAKSTSQVGPSNLYVSTPTGSSMAQLTTNDHSVDPLWGALGITYVQFKNRGHGDAPAYQLWLMNAKAQSRQITHTRPGPLVEGLVPIAVSANGQRLIAGFQGEDTDNTFTVNLLTHAVHQIRVGKQIVTPWGISRDGKRLLVDVGGFENDDNAGEIESVPFAGGKPTVLEQHGDYPSW